ncbi:hypothetical protein K0M31_007102 [Melipona bicolor]|uniref:Uncharacterized protein n=1 Tax=Melipona bicolor TaxID=60889 RepID=A0AA40KL40_9HYME|nr:hypothetical protein K0M31_007102 [Melipona bicolor]
MERTGSDLQQLIVERGRVEADLTRLKSFYDTRGETEPITSLRLRLKHNLDLRQRYEAIHDRIIAAVASSADVEAHDRCLDEFEDMYYRVLGAIQERIDNSQQQRQRGAAHRTDEAPPAKRNLLSPTLDGDAGSNGVKLDLLTDLTTNLSDGELLINNDAHKTGRDVEEREEEVESKDETAKVGVEVIRGIHGTVTSIDTTDFLRGDHARDPENLGDSHDQRNASSSSHGIGHTGFVGSSTPTILELGVARKSSESSTSRDDPSAPSASRTPDDHFSGTRANIAGYLTSSSLTAPPAVHQGHYRGVADQFEGSPTRKSARNRLQAHRDRRCRSNRLRTIGNTCFSNSAKRYLEYITRKEVLHDDKEHHRNRDDNNANISRRHSKTGSVARRNDAFLGKWPAARASTAAGAAPAAKRVNSR